MSDHHGTGTKTAPLPNNMPDRVTRLEHEQHLLREEISSVKATVESTRASVQTIEKLLTQSQAEQNRKLATVQKDTKERTRTNWALWGIVVSVALAAIGAGVVSLNRPGEVNIEWIMRSIDRLDRQDTEAREDQRRMIEREITNARTLGKLEAAKEMLKK